MNKKFTKLMAALALLVFMMPSMVGWGQSDYSTTYTSGVTLSTSGGTSATVCKIIVTGSTQYDGIKAGTGSVAGAMKINVPSGTKYLHIHVAGWKGETVSLSVTPDSNISPSSISLTSDDGISSNTPFTLDTPANAPTNYYKVITFTNALTSDTQFTFAASSGKRFVIWGVNAEEEGSTGPTCTIDPTSWNFGEVTVDENAQKEFTVNTSNLTGNLSVSTSGAPYSVNTAIILQEATSTTVTVTFTPTAVGSVEGSLTIFGGGLASDVSVALNGTGVCAPAATALAYPTPGDQILVNGEVSYTLEPVTGTGNGGPVNYSITTNPDNKGEIQNDNIFHATGIGQYVVHAEQALYGTTCGGTADITINVYGPDQTITFNPGSGTSTPSITAPQGSTIQLPTATPSTGCSQAGWTFAGWTDEAITKTTTVPTILLAAGDDYLVSTNETLYAVYSVTEGNAFDNQSDGEFPIYAIVGENTFYATGSVNNKAIAQTTNPSQATLYSFEKQENGSFAIKCGDTYIAASGNDLTTSNTAYGWTISSSTHGSWRLASQTSGRGLIFRASTYNTFKNYATSNVNGTEYFDLEIGGSSTTTYNSNPVCQLATLNVTLNNIGANFAEDDWSHVIVFNEGSAQLAVGAKVLVSVYELDDCHSVGESPLVVVDGNNDPVDIMFDEEDYSYYFFMPESGASLTATSEALPQSTLTVEIDANVTIEQFMYGELSAIVELDDDHTAELCEGVEVTVQVAIGEGYVLQSLTVVGSNGQAVLLEEAGNNTYTFTMPATGATLSATTDIDFPTNLEYALYSGDLVEGDYVIYYYGYAMKNTIYNSRLEYSLVNPSEDVISNPAASIVWHIAPSETEGYWTIYNVAVNKYAAGTGADNKAQLLGQIGTDGKALWESTATTENGISIYEFVNKYNSENNKNANLRNNGANGWACYNPNNVGGALSLYKKVEYASETEIGAYNTTTGAGWHFIASPFVGEISHNVNAGAEGTDLYFYDEQNHHWRNYKTEANQSGFDFANGKGYLYANSEDITLQFAGTSIVTSETRAINLSYHATTAGGEENSLAGWNLVGNPYNCNATLDKDCYIINGNAINTEAQTANEYLVGPCKGVLVKATENGETVTFTKVAAGQTPQPNQLQMIVAQQVVTRNGASTGSATVEDNAIVCFNEGNRLEKFAFNADAAKLYIPQNGKEYAIVSAEAQGEMPVNFRATKNGTYTLTVNPEGVEMNYLHLIDNMTGANVDLLATPTYTFNASTTDYESRFRLVFSANNAIADAASEETFAFFSNGSLIVNNEGEATLQVVDMMGRVVSNQTVNGTTELSLNQVPGVYVLRLVSGDNVRTQKLIVK